MLTQAKSNIIKWKNNIEAKFDLLRNHILLLLKQYLPFHLPKKTYGIFLPVNIGIQILTIYHPTDIHCNEYVHCIAYNNLRFETLLSL